MEKDGTIECLNANLNKLERKRQGKKETTSLLCIDSQSVKVAAFISEDKGIHGNKLVNGRKRHIIVNTLGLVWGIIVHAADINDGTKAYLLVEHCLRYLDRMQKILVDDAYKKVFYDWVYDNIIGLKVEFASRPPSAKGFVPVKWRWGNAAMELRELSLSLDFSEGTQKTTKSNWATLRKFCRGRAITKPIAK